MFLSFDIIGRYLICALLSNCKKPSFYKPRTVKKQETNSKNQEATRNEFFHGGYKDWNSEKLTVPNHRVSKECHSCRVQWNCSCSIAQTNAERNEFVHRLISQLQWFIEERSFIYNVFSDSKTTIKFDRAIVRRLLSPRLKS